MYAYMRRDKIISRSDQSANVSQRTTYNRPGITDALGEVFLIASKVCGAPVKRDQYGTVSEVEKWFSRGLPERGLLKNFANKKYT